MIVQLLLALSLSLVSAQTTWNVSIANFAFTPTSLNIQTGDTVQWTNTQGFHSVTSGPNCQPDSLFNHAAASAPYTFNYTFTNAGTFEYYCIPHCSSSNMFATITVVNAPSATTSTTSTTTTSTTATSSSSSSSSTTAATTSSTTTSNPTVSPTSTSTTSDTSFVTLSFAAVLLAFCCILI